MSVENLTQENPATLSFEMRKGDLLALLEKAAVVVPTKDIIPVLANFKIQCTATIKVTTSNLDLSMICASKDVSIEQPGIAFFPVRKFLEIVKECSSEISVQVYGQQATISSGRTTWTLKLHSGIGYPALPETSDLVLKEVDRTQLSLMLRRTKYAASMTPAKAALMMIAIEKEKMTACDGIRLHQVVIKGFPLDLQIPIEAVDDILKLIDGKLSFDEIKIGESTNHILLLAGSDVLIINKLAEVFPDVKTLMLGPALRNQRSIKIEIDSLITALKQVRTVADAEIPAVALVLWATMVTLKSLDRYQSECHATVDVLEVGEKFCNATVILNHRMLMQTLRSLQGDIVELRFAEGAKNKKNPVLFKDAHGSIAVLQQMSSSLLENS